MESFRGLALLDFHWSFQTSKCEDKITTTGIFFNFVLSSIFYSDITTIIITISMKFLPEYVAYPVASQNLPNTHAQLTCAWLCGFLSFFSNFRFVSQAFKTLLPSSSPLILYCTRDIWMFHTASLVWLANFMNITQRRFLCCCVCHRSKRLQYSLKERHFAFSFFQKIKFAYRKCARCSSYKNVCVRDLREIILELLRAAVELQS